MEIILYTIKHMNIHLKYVVEAILHKTNININIDLDFVILSYHFC